MDCRHSKKRRVLRGPVRMVIAGKLVRYDKGQERRNVLKINVVCIHKMAAASHSKLLLNNVYSDFPMILSDFE